ncbi:MAG: ABC transporter ATP-binding protein [Atopobiaceae bacterium]
MKEASCPLVFEGLEKRYPDITVGPVSLSVPQGMVLGLIGANGAGKTTLIRSALGLVRLTGGRVLLFGEDPKDLSAAELIALKQHIASVCAVCPYPEDYTAEDIVRLYQSLYPTFDAPYVHELLERFELKSGTKGLARLTIKSLSRGQGMKLQIALALASGAELLLLDEPTAGLDPIIRTEVLACLREHLAKAPETSILISSHITSDLESFADRIVLMDKGQIVFEEDADVLEERFALLALRTSDFEEKRGTLKEAGAARYLREGGHLLVLVEDRKRFTHTFPNLALEPLSLDALLRLAVKGKEI